MMCFDADFCPDVTSCFQEALHVQQYGGLFPGVQNDAAGFLTLIWNCMSQECTPTVQCLQAKWQRQCCTCMTVCTVCETFITCESGIYTVCVQVYIKVEFGGQAYS